MDSPSEHWSAIIAVAVGSVAAAAAIAAATLRMRRRGYVASETGRTPRFLSALETSIQNRPPPDLPAFTAVKARLLADHQQAVRLQTTYLFLARTNISLLWIAFAATAISLTVGAAAHASHLYAATLDAVALGAVLLLFFVGRQVRSRWIRKRAQVEIMRSWVSTWGPFHEGPAADLEERYGTEAGQVYALVAKPHADLDKAIAGYWKAHLGRFTAYLRGQPSLSWDRIATYCRRRVLRQGRWFEDSRTRLETEDRRRAVLLGVLFAAALGLAVTKLLFSLAPHAGSSGEKWVALGLLVAIGTSTALVGMHYGQNSRSLLHRYGTQLRNFHRWFESNPQFIAIAEKGKDCPKSKIGAVAAAIAGFEILMEIELADWLEISEMDSLEISAS